MNAVIVEGLRHSRGADISHPFCDGLLYVRAEVGSLVVLDEGKDRLGERLLKGDPEPFGKGWPGCDFRWPNPVHEWREKHAIACNIHVVGRKSRRGRDVRPSLGNGYWVRIQVEWVGDCSPNSYGLGWMKIER